MLGLTWFRLGRIWGFLTAYVDFILGFVVAAVIVSKAKGQGSCIRAFIWAAYRYLLTQIVAHMLPSKWR